MIVPLAPITPTGLICLGCGKQMRLHVEQYKNGKVSRIVFYCDTCKYGHEPSMMHAPGQTVAYQPPADPQPLPEKKTLLPPELTEASKAGTGG
jgi:hypothetical protein